MSWAEIIAFLAVGVVTGVLSGLMGVGGGLLMVPALVLLARFGQHAAQGTSLVAIIPTAIAGAYRHYQNGFVRLGDALGLTLGGILGALIGSASALNLEGSVLRGLFAVVLAFTGVRLILGGRRVRGGKLDLDEGRDPGHPE